MVDFVSLGKGLKTAYEIARSAKDVNDQAKLNTAIADIMEQLTSAQFSLFEMQQHQELIDENRQLKDQLERAARFDKYQLQQTSTGDYVLVLKDEFAVDGTPKHVICPVCKEDERLAVMTEDGHWYRCSSCKYVAGKKKLPPPRRRTGPMVV
ncbi:hypothetical protein [Halomonas sp. BN3-1]|uniref:hypothetical protein n=1 Tax=Halomonas sp. BN3-1 TaxID=2082393 RepID=UPI000D35DE86|nr:hypothetical protein [Halomonas sp. BN3-1]